MYGTPRVHTIAGATDHKGDHRDFVRRCQQRLIRRRNSATDRDALEEHLASWIADFRNLRTAYEFICRNGGSAHGPNGIRPGDLSRDEQWQLLRVLSRSLNQQTYVHGPVRHQRICKPETNETRTLTIQNIEDRVVERAASQLLYPYLEPRLHRDCYGARLRLDRRHALARALQLTTAHQSTLWWRNDIRGCFDKIPVRRLQQILGRWLPGDVIVLIDRILITARRGRRQAARRGLRQGGSLSPLLANVYLDHVVARPFADRCPDMSLLRYVDDLLVPIPSGSSASEVQQELTRICISASMPLKYDRHSAIVNPSVARVTWLGYEVSLSTGVPVVRLKASAWNELAEHFRRSHDRPDPTIWAESVLHGWLAQAAPAHEQLSLDALLRRLNRIAESQGLDTLIHRDKVADIWSRAIESWDQILCWNEAIRPRSTRKREETDVRKLVLEDTEPPW